MEPIIPAKLKEEQEMILAQWLESDEDIELFDYAIQNGSSELKQFLLHEKSRKEKAREIGIIIN